MILVGGLVTTDFSICLISFCMNSGYIEEVWVVLQEVIPCKYNAKSMNSRYFI